MCVLNLPPNKTIGDDTPYYRMSGKFIDLSFLQTIGSRPHEDIKRILRCLHGTLDLHITYSCSSNLKLIGFCDASCGTDNSAKARSTSGSMYFLFGGVVYFCTSIQQIAAQSTTEAELIMQEVRGLPMWNPWRIGWTTFCSDRIFCDNKGA